MPSLASLSRFGVLPDMIPWLYAPMLNHPTSSPMITRMLGFLSCAHAARADDKPMIAPINKPITKNLLLQACIEMYLLRSFRLLLQLEVESAMLVGCSDGLHEALD